jgi:hypothetical protein
MKDLIFNELTETPLATDFTAAMLRVEQLLFTYKARPENLFNRGIRLDKHIGQIPIATGHTIQGLVAMGGRARTLGTTLLALGRYPYLEEGSEEEERYIQNRYYILKNGNRYDVIGLAAAYLQNTITIGFESEEYWQSCNHTMSIENDDAPDEAVEVLSVSSPQHFSEPSLSQWVDNHTEIELVETTLVSSDKQIHLREDHGIDVLLPFARRLLGNCYVECVVNSCEFSPHNRRFVRSANDYGVIEITLPWTDQGLGLVVQTTGRNKRETEKIAEILQEKYSR